MSFLGSEWGMEMRSDFYFQTFFLCLGPGLAILPKPESTPSLSASTTPSPSDGAGGDFREPVHLVEIVGARPENEFINAHIALALDRLFHRRA